MGARRSVRDAAPKYLEGVIQEGARWHAAQVPALRTCFGLHAGALGSCCSTSPPQVRAQDSTTSLGIPHMYDLYTQGTDAAQYRTLRRRALQESLKYVGCWQHSTGTGRCSALLRSIFVFTEMPTVDAYRRKLGKLQGANALEMQTIVSQKRASHMLCRSIVGRIDAPERILYVKKGINVGME